MMKQEITYATGWRLADASLREDVADFLRDIPPQDDEHKDEKQRAAQMAVIAYAGTTILAVSMLEVKFLERVKQKFAFIRIALHPAHENNQALSDGIIQATRDMIQAYAESHPQEEIYGMAMIMKKPGGGEEPILPAGRLALIGYTDRKEQVRVGWFPHVRVRPKQKNAYS